MKMIRKNNIINNNYDINSVNNFYLVFIDDNIGNWDNRFNSPLEYGETIDNINTFVESIMIINLATLVSFNLLVFVLANRAIIPYILKWLEAKLSNNNLLYKLVERTYKANMKISIWLIGYIIILI